jgi:hypothetical protein
VLENFIALKAQAIAFIRDGGILFAARFMQKTTLDRCKGGRYDKLHNLIAIKPIK